MKPHLALFAGLAIGLALWVTGCESDGGVSARAQEKSSVYVTLKPWQKRLVDKGTIGQGLTPDMVYIAMGKPDQVETKEDPQGHVELWTYTHFYPNVDAIHGFRHAGFTTESAYQPQIPQFQDQGNGPYHGPLIPYGMAGHPESIGKISSGQGGTIEPADLRSYTVKVLFASDKVVQIGADENP
jgi:hypothetical protein